MLVINCVDVEAILTELLVGCESERKAPIVGVFSFSKHVPDGVALLFIDTVYTAAVTLLLGEGVPVFRSEFKYLLNGGLGGAFGVLDDGIGVTE